LVQDEGVDERSQVCLVTSDLTEHWHLRCGGGGGGGGGNSVKEH
jgi:hypothetical protein